MSQKITLEPMTAEMYHAYFKEYEEDADTYFDKNDFTEYIYDESKVNAYIERQNIPSRRAFAIMREGEMIGELKIYDIIPGKSASLGIAIKNSSLKNRGFGSAAEKLAVEYVFRELDIPVLNAACIKTNTRSSHVLKKVGFVLTGSDEKRNYWQTKRPE